MLSYLVRGHKPVKLIIATVAAISEDLLALKDYIPDEFARKPRKLAKFYRWKATELRQLLLYTGHVVLKKYVKSEVYEHFLCLSVAISILLSKTEVISVNYARQLLQLFVKNSSVVYGESFVAYNVHSIIHLAEDVVTHGRTLNNLSCFPFENFLFRLKKIVKSPINPVVQVAKTQEHLDRSITTIPRVQKLDWETSLQAVLTATY